ncbi:MAG: transketolase C-terminal domain-containing protein [Elusimicrobiota bacterium]
MRQRQFSYVDAIREATCQEMRRDDGVIVLGMGVDDPKAILGTTKGLLQEFGPQRVFDTPLAEEGMLGVAIGAALGGLRPMHVHIRMDFLLLAMNQLINMAAKMRYMSGGQVKVPVVIRAMIGKSWGQGPQHSQALQALLMHIPGLKVVAPSLPYDAKGCLISAIRDDNPVVYIEHRMLHFQKGHVPERTYTVAPGSSRILNKGKDITIVGTSYMALESFRAARLLEGVGIAAEVIDPVWLAPLEMRGIFDSAARTKRLLVVDNAWLTCGASAEILARVAENPALRKCVEMRRMGFAPVTCPTTSSLEEHFYPDAQGIAAEAYAMIHPGGGQAFDRQPLPVPEEIVYKGPF